MSDATPFLPEERSVSVLRAAAMACRGCDLYRDATQTVFGEGTSEAPMMLVGEQPGDHEDREGRPFVGPAGRILDEALESAGIDRRMVYVTNAVKHFKFQARGKKRIHRKPDLAEMMACRPWLTSELQAVRPAVLVCLGATAAQTLIDPQFRVTRERGRFVESDLAPHVIATVHPSSILRTDPPDRDEQMEAFVSDLAMAASRLHASADP